MNFLGYTLTLRRLETVAERFGRYAPRTMTNLRQVALPAAREKALAADATAAEAEEALDGARKKGEVLRVANDEERQRLAMVARQEREAADDAPSRRLARQHDAAAAAAERDLAALEEAEQAAEAELAPLEISALARREEAHIARARALRVLRDAAYADAELAARDAEAEAQAIEREFGRRGLRRSQIP